VTLQADLIAVNEEIAVKQSGMAELLKDIDTLEGDKAHERATAIKAANTELGELSKKREPLDAAVAEINRAKEGVKAMSRGSGRQFIPTNDAGAADDEDEYEPAIKSVKQLLRSAEGYQSAIKAGRQFRGSFGEMAVKTLIQSSSLAPLADRQATIQPYLTEERFTVGDMILPGTTSGQVVQYYEETTFTNAAAGVTEGNAKPESALDFTLRSENVRKYATFVPVTDEMLADVPAFESYIRQRLGFMVRQVEESALINGTGTAPAVQGILGRSGVQTVTGYGLSTLDSIYKAITLIRANAFAEPTGLVVNPLDWFDIRTSKDANGNYLLGPATSEGDLSIWGLAVRVTTNIAQNTALVGAFRPHAQIFRRSGIDIAISTENEDYFIKNKVAVRAEERFALAVYRPSAFCKVEAIVQGS
jgi:HK97 family phage major capsid protein